MQIARVSFKGDVLDFSKAHQIRQNGNHKPQTPVKQDSFERSKPVVEGLEQDAIDQAAQNPIIREDNPIYYARIFDNIEKRIRTNSKLHRITPEEAAKEVIQILKDGKAIKVLSDSYDNKKYKEVLGFINSFDDLDKTLEDSKLDENTYIAIDTLASPIKEIIDDFDSKGILVEDDEDDSFADKAGYLVMEKIVEIEERGTDAQKAEIWELLKNVIRFGHQVEEFPTFNLSIPSCPGLNPETWTNTFSKIMGLINEARQDYPCNPENYLPEDAED